MGSPASRRWFGWSAALCVYAALACAGARNGPSEPPVDPPAEPPAGAPTGPPAAPPPGPPPTTPPGPGGGILFIGNSLTYSHNLPALLQATARANGHPSLTVEAVTLGGANLEDHWVAGAALRAIDRGGWSVVIMQQGPSSQPDSRVHLRHWAARFAERIRAVGATPALYMVWPSSSRPGDFQGVSDSYRLAAQDVGGLLIPVGDAWRAAWRRDSRLSLYEDGLHPTITAVSLAVLTFHGVLFRERGEDLPGTVLTAAGSPVGLPPETWEILRAAAEDVLP